MTQNPKRMFALAMTSLVLSSLGYAQSIPSFTPPVTYAAPGSSAVASGDMNGDGRVDIIAANGATPGSHGVSILLSNGDGTFQPGVNFVTNTDPTSLVVGDFNGDGKLDVAAATKAANSISILLGNGDGTLQQATTIVLSSSPLVLATSDLNNDGKADLVVTQVTINPLTGTGTYFANTMLSNGDGTFGQATFQLFGLNIAIGDFNADGKPDIFYYPGGVAPAIKFGNGDGTFTDSPLPFSTNANSFTANHIVTGDFNGDGKLDLYGEYITPQVTRSPPGFIGTMELGNGDGTFNVLKAVGNLGTDGQNLIAGDFNRDGRLDVAAVFPGPYHFLPTTGYSVKVLYGNGDGTLAPSVSFPSGISATVFTGNPIVAADFDGNSALDFAVATSNGVTVIRNAQGNPPLISKFSVNSNWVVGGVTNILASLTLGDPAPAGGTVLTLTSSNPAVATFPGGAVITIPAGSNSATLTIATSVVAAAGLVTVTASSSGASQTATFNVVPAYTLSSVSFAPVSGYGWFGGGSGAVGTVTLSSVAIDGVVVSLAASNPALFSVPASIAVAAGSSTATFSAFALNRVAADTPVTVSGSLDAITKSGVYTVLTGIDTVKITKAEYTVKNAVLQVQATDSNPAAQIRVLSSTGNLLAILLPAGGGSYKGAASVPGPFTTVFLQSTLGGFVSGPVAQK